jgi:hypothetical protein
MGYIQARQKTRKILSLTMVVTTEYLGLLLAAKKINVVSMM